MLLAADLRQETSLKLADRPLRELLETLSADCGLEIVADSATLDRPVAILAEQTPVWRTIQAAAEQAGIFWFPDDDALLISERTADADKGEADDPFAHTNLAAQDVVAFVVSLSDQQRNIFLEGNVLPWKSLAEPQAELVLNMIKRLRDGLPWSIGGENKGLTVGVALVFDPCIQYRLPGKPPWRAFFRGQRALVSLMSVGPTEDGRAFAPIAPLAPNADAATDTREKPREYTLSQLTETAFAPIPSPIPLPPFGDRAVAVFGLKKGRDPKWLFDRAVNCLGVREQPYGETKALFIPSFQLSEDWKTELQFAPVVGVPRYAVTQALKPFMASVNLEAEGYPFSTAEFLENSRFDSEAIEEERLEFLLANLPKGKTEELVDPETGRLRQCEIQLRNSLLLAVFAYQKDRFTKHPLRGSWTCFIQIQADYGELLPQVSAKGAP